MQHNFFFALCFCIINSLKYVVFGLWDGFNDIAFDFVQFAVLNNHLILDNNTKYQVAYDLSFWAFFGLSPDPNADNAIANIYNLLYHDKNTSNYNMSNHNMSNHNMSNYRRRPLSNDTIDDNLTDIINWFDKNKFLITATVLFTIIAATFIIYMMCSLIKIKCGYMFKKKKHIVAVDAIPIRDGSLHSIEGTSWNASYFTFLIKVILISYCSLATITIATILDMKTSQLAIDFMAIFVLIFIIGFPLYVLVTLHNNKAILYRQDFMDKFGPLYLGFKNSSLNINFMVLVLIKQLLYAITLNISSRMNFIQNSLLLILNILFVILLHKYRPYAKNIYQTQALIMCYSMIIICFINYGILSVENEHTQSWIKIFNTCVYIISFTMLICMQIYAFVQERKKPKIQLHSIDSDGIQLLRRSDDDNDNDDTYINPIYNPEYELPKSKRYAQVLSQTLTSVQ